MSKSPPTPATRAQITRIEESIAYLTGLTQGIDQRIKDLETRLALLEARVSQPVGGLKR